MTQPEKYLKVFCNAESIELHVLQLIPSNDLSRALGVSNRSQEHCLHRHWLILNMANARNQLSEITR